MKTQASHNVAEIVDYIIGKLDCSQKLISTYTGLNESTISANLSRDINDVASKKSGKRLLALYLAIHEIEDQTEEAIREALSAYVFEDLEGNMDSVITAIVNEKYPPNVIAKIAVLGLQQYKQKVAARGIGLYEAVRSAVANA